MSSMDTVLDLCAAAHPDHLAVTLDDEQASFATVADQAARYALALDAWGVRRGDIVLCRFGISLDNIYVHCALARIGAVFAPVDPACSERELGDIVAYVEPRFLIADERGEALCAEATRGTGVALGIFTERDGATAGLNLGRAARASRPTPCGERPRPDDIHAMYLTSGSTGRPKAVAIAHRANWLRAHLAANTISSRGMVNMFPLFHMAGWQVIAQSWARRRAVHLVHHADAEPLLEAVERWGASTLYAIPAVWKRILECRKPYDLRTLRGADAGTSYVGPELIMALRERFPGTHNMLGYGSTEMGTGLQIAHEDILRKPGSVGLPPPAVEARIDDGELLLRGPMMMEGYYRLPKETASVVTDGWYRTGDLAERDADGFHTITGRRREIIRSGGETISPVELDALLKRIDGVADIAVVGLPHPDWGEVVCVAVVSREGYPSPSLDTVRSALGGINPRKLPRAIREVPAIPRTPATGQVRRTVLREMILTATTVGDSQEREACPASS